MYFIKCKKGVAVCSNLCSESYAYILLLFNENFLLLSIFNILFISAVLVKRGYIQLLDLLHKYNRQEKKQGSKVTQCLCFANT